jgi:hypothetical protein
MYTKQHTDSYTYIYFKYYDMTPEGRKGGARGEFTVRQRLGTQVSAATREELLRTMIHIRSVQSGYKEEFS